MRDLGLNEQEGRTSEEHHERQTETKSSRKENHGNREDGDGDNEGWRVVTDSMGHRTGGAKAVPKPAVIADRPAGVPSSPIGPGPGYVVGEE